LGQKSLKNLKTEKEAQGKEEPIPENGAIEQRDIERKDLTSRIPIDV